MKWIEGWCVQKKETWKMTGYLLNDAGYLRVWTEWSSNNEERKLIIVQSPESLVIASSIQIPDMETLSHGQPAGKVLRVCHGNEQDVRLVTRSRLWEEVRITW